MVSTCVGSYSFDPDKRIEDNQALEKAVELLEKDDFEGAITSYFDLAKKPDFFKYHAIITVKLPEAQEVVNRGGEGKLHAWYWTDAGDPLPPPPQADIISYISIFLPTTSTDGALKSFSSNAKRESLRARSAAHLKSKRFILPAHPLAKQLSSISKAKAKRPPSQNPYLDFWAWSCRNLEWCGPVSVPEAPGVGRDLALCQRSHQVLPVFMHHFGCCVPSHEALTLLKTLAEGRTVADIGSGNGYWTFMLRRYGVEVVPVDSGQSEWRAMWVHDTVKADGLQWLFGSGSRKKSATSTLDRGKNIVLLMVYPIVGGTYAGGEEGGLTRSLVNAFQGDTIAIVGTQNPNGYTGFKDMTMDEYMEREQKEWTKVVQIALPSFAGKDDALYVFQRGERVLGKTNGE